MSPRTKNGRTEIQTFWIVGATVGFFVLVIGIFGGLYFYQAPRNAFETLRVASSAGDLAVVQQYVDLPSLRASVKSYLIESGAAQIESSPEASNPVARQIIRFGKMLVEAALDPIVAVAVSPFGISAFLDGIAPSKNGADTGADARVVSAQQLIIETSFASMDIFVVSIYRKAEQRWAMQLFFRRTGIFEWKLAAIRPL